MDDRRVAPGGGFLWHSNLPHRSGCLPTWKSYPHHSYQLYSPLVFPLYTAPPLFVGRA
jgi:hypothetical protein